MEIENNISEITKHSGTLTCEIITIGSELLIGQIEDTNTTYIAREMGLLGITVQFRTAVGDRLEEIVRVIKSAVERNDFIITTGGLGPTLDDLTREAVAHSAGVKLEFRKDAMDKIKDIFKKSGYKMSENNIRQAYTPEGSITIHNPVGTAPAFIKEISGIPVICLPGVPNELKVIMGKKVVPWLKDRFNLDRQIHIYKVVKIVGIGESMVDNLIGDLIVPGNNPEIGLLASTGEIKIRIAATGENKERALELIRPIEQEIRSRLGKRIYGEGQDTLESVVDSLLRRKNFTLATFETFSGGLMALKFYGIYANSLKESRVIKEKKLVAKFMSMNDIIPSSEKALELAELIRKTVDADVGAAILGFPGRYDEKIYKVEGFTAAKSNGIERTFSWTMGGELEIIQQRAAVIGLNTLRLALI
jgi:nicotinamide-nucleotide amidase